MLPRLILVAGIGALAAGLGTYFVRGNGYEHRDYPITITKTGSKYVVSQKQGFALSYHGSTHWEIFNNTEDKVIFEVVNFSRDAGNDCPVEFTGNTGSTVNCIGSARMAARTAEGEIDSDTIKVKRGDAYTAQKYTFDMKINGITIDPDLELERDPPTILLLMALIGTVLSALAAWLTRRRS